MTGQCGTVWIWQDIVSPHMVGLAAALVQRGCDVVYVAEQEMSSERADQGWVRPDLGGVALVLAPSAEAIRALVRGAPSDSIHICQGMRGNGRIGIAQSALAARRLRQWVMMETVDDAGVIGVIKRLIYRVLSYRMKDHLEGVLAIGRRMPDWISARGLARSDVFPFAYFLPDIAYESIPPTNMNHRFRFLYVGQFIRRKRLDMLIEALADIKHYDFELTVIGSGPLEGELRALAQSKLFERVHWLGCLSMSTVHKEMAKADCLVLPSRHDGWGAVVSEALMRGTPVIASDACGASVVVKASGVGGVFCANDRDGLTARLRRAIDERQPSLQQRRRIANWARCLGAEAGADYFLSTAAYVAGKGPLPAPPWQVSG